MSPPVAVSGHGRFLLVRVRASRMRKDSPSVTTTVAWCRSLSSRLVAVTCSGRNRPHSSNGQWLAMPRARRPYAAATNRNSSWVPLWSRAANPISSIYAEGGIDRRTGLPRAGPARRRAAVPGVHRAGGEGIGRGGVQRRVLRARARGLAPSPTQGYAPPLWTGLPSRPTSSRPAPNPTGSRPPRKRRQTTAAASANAT
jgi:hypothetical protein